MLHYTRTTEPLQAVCDPKLAVRFVIALELEKRALHARGHSCTPKHTHTFLFCKCNTVAALTELHFTLLWPMYMYHL